MNMADAKIPWRHFGRLLCFQSWTYLLVLGTKLLFITLLPGATGLLTRQFFDSLTGNAPLVGGINGLVWLFICQFIARPMSALFQEALARTGYAICNQITQNA